MNDRLPVLDINSIIRILPHKPPATLIDRVIEVEPGEKILTAKTVTISERAVSGHFPGMPILPGSTIIEVMVQTCCLLAYATDRYNPATKTANLVGINKAKFHRVVGPGETIETEAHLLRQHSNVWRFEVRVYEDDRRLAEAELALSLVERDDTL